MRSKEMERICPRNTRSY